ncbi:MAG: TatD family nuclease-associated radical SAM protein [Elusimicrobia bacterium]|nr:TatD family nuclease-associated radical SAM protein [Elusimicrobiota bacterium]
METQKPSVVYRYRNGLYVNLTNRCPTACVFCIKNAWKMDYRGSSLDLAGKEPAPEEVIALAALEWAKEPFEEFVFCGYGEPTMRLEALLACARLIRSGAAAPLPRALRVRLNTNGLANAVWRRDVVPEMKGLIDSVHVSLNTADPAQWAALMRPLPAWEASGFEKVKEFIRSAARALPETFATAVEGNDIDLEKFRALAAELGAAPRIRGRLEDAAGEQPRPSSGGGGKL